MATTYTLIASNTLGSSAASVTFSAIPNTYTDLIVKTSARWDNTGNPYLFLRFNSDTATNYSYTVLYNSAGTVGSSRSSNQTRVVGGALTSSGATSNTFSNGEFYIPNYLASINKPISAFDVDENNNATTDIFQLASAGLWRNTSAITDISMFVSSGNFVSGSSFFLYGIKNS